jgi:hypothetical protein
MLKHTAPSFAGPQVSPLILFKKILDFNLLLYMHSRNVDGYEMHLCQPVTVRLPVRGQPMFREPIVYHGAVIAQRSSLINAEQQGW